MHACVFGLGGEVPGRGRREDWGRLGEVQRAGVVPRTWMRYSLYSEGPMTLCSTCRLGAPTGCTVTGVMS